MQSKNVIIFKIKDFFVCCAVTMLVYCFILPLSYVLIAYEKIAAKWLEWYYTKRGIRFHKQWDKFSYTITRY